MFLLLLLPLGAFSSDARKLTSLLQLQYTPVDNATPLCWLIKALHNNHI